MFVWRYKPHARRYAYTSIRTRYQPAKYICQGLNATELQILVENMEKKVFVTGSLSPRPPSGFSPPLYFTAKAWREERGGNLSISHEFRSLSEHILSCYRITSLHLAFEMLETDETRYTFNPARNQAKRERGRGKNGERKLNRCRKDFDKYCMMIQRESHDARKLDLYLG